MIIVFMFTWMTNAFAIAETAESKSQLWLPTTKCIALKSSKFDLMI